MYCFDAPRPGGAGRRLRDVAIDDAIAALAIDPRSTTALTALAFRVIE
jgi:hypothetical protein